MPQVFGLAHLALVAALRDERDRAHRIADDALALALARDSGLHEHWAAATAHTVRGCVRRDGPGGGLADLRRGVELGRRGVGPVDLAYGLLVLAEAVRVAGNVTAADDAMDEARSVLASCPDPGVLPQLFGTVQRAPDTGDELSERELAVLRLLPSEMSQREIGDHLYVSLNTVKTHTRNIFRKLGATGRDDAVARARARGLLSRGA